MGIDDPGEPANMLVTRYTQSQPPINARRDQHVSSDPPADIAVLAADEDMTEPAADASGALGGDDCSAVTMPAIAHEMVATPNAGQKTVGQRMRMAFPPPAGATPGGGASTLVSALPGKDMTAPSLLNATS